MNIRRMIGVIMAVVMVLALIPASALSAGRTAPEGYDEYEYNKLVAFMEQTDADGVKNGEKFSEDYDPADPSTWGSGNVFFEYPVWDDGVYHVTDVTWHCNTLGADLCGSLDLSGFQQLSFFMIDNCSVTAIDVSNCPELSMVEIDRCARLKSFSSANCESLQDFILTDSGTEVLNISNCPSIDGSLMLSDNKLRKLDATGCSSITTLVCSNNVITDLVLTGCTSLESLYCENNKLTELDLNELTSLNILHCDGNPMTLIFCEYTELHMNTVNAEGNGTVGYIDTQRTGGAPLIHLIAVPNEGETFLGWYGHDGECMSTDLDWDVSEIIDDIDTDVTAIFTETGLRGDVNCDGAVDWEDVTVLSAYTVDSIELTEQGIINGDFDCNGEINSVDISYLYNFLLNNN